MVFFRGGRGTASQIKAMVFFRRRGVRVKVAASALVFIPQRRLCVCVCVLHPVKPLFLPHPPFFC